MTDELTSPLAGVPADAAERPIPADDAAGAVDLSGLTPEQATDQLKAAYAHFGKGQVLVVGGGFEMPIDYAKIDRHADVERMVADAMAVGRSGNPVERVILNTRTAVRGHDVAPVVVFDEARLAR